MIFFDFNNSLIVICAQMTNFGINHAMFDIMYFRYNYFLLFAASNIAAFFP